MTESPHGVERRALAMILHILQQAYVHPNVDLDKQIKKMIKELLYARE